MTFNRIRRRKLLEIPRFEALPYQAREALNALDTQLCFLPVLHVDALDQVGAERWRRLEHELSDLYMAANSSGPKPDRTKDESAILAFFGDQSPLTGDYDAFKAVLTNALSVTSLGHQGLRRGEVGLGINRTGHQILFPLPHDISTGLHNCHRHIIAGGNAIWVGIGAMLTILNCHPFNDGNGRVARMLFNYILTKSGYRGFFQLSYVIRRTRGAFELSIRAAEIGGDWLPILTYIGGALTIMHDRRR